MRFRPADRARSGPSAAVPSGAPPGRGDATFARLYGRAASNSSDRGRIRAALFRVWSWVVEIVARPQRARHLRAARAALPDAMSLMASALSAGHTLELAVAAAARARGPLQAEFARALALIRLGEPAPEALDVMASRLASEDLHWVTVAMRINSTVGGDLGRLLRTLADTMRERETLRRTARALSAEGRLSAWVLGALPPVFVGFLLLMQPRHLAPLVADYRGWTLIGAAVLLFVVGILWLRRAVRLEV